MSTLLKTRIATQDRAKGTVARTEVDSTEPMARAREAFQTLGPARGSFNPDRQTSFSNAPENLSYGLAAFIARSRISAGAFSGLCKTQCWVGAYCATSRLNACIWSSQGTSTSSPFPVLPGSVTVCRSGVTVPARFRAVKSSLPVSLGFRLRIPCHGGRYTAGHP